MSTRQIAACAARIADPAKRKQFTDMMDEARELFRTAAEIRAAAWQHYYASTGKQPRAVLEMLR